VLDGLVGDALEVGFKLGFDLGELEGPLGIVWFDCDGHFQRFCCFQYLIWSDCSNLAIN
jgi:hypothetical protein